VAAFGALSYLVGMVCPGLHSIFSTLEATWGEGIELRFSVRRYDARFRQMHIEFDGALRGSLRAFVRPEPQVQPSVAMLSSLVEAGAFEGTHSLVVGGSRGIGEVTAKAIAAGGGTVVITYAQGEADARRVESEINAAWPGRCRVGRYVAGETAPAALGDAAAFDAVFYFATPRIFRKSGGHFDRALFDDFVGTYVADFMRVGEWLDQAGAGRNRPVRLFYPSSTAVAERPRGMTEYSMAKAAAELMIEDFNRAQRRVQVIVARLPRLPTDQTATLMQAKAESTAGVMLPVIRRMLAR
jgi:NAD(P)-dependent dehydrogenase (short-subunit alcohol dehydrogenase family)